MKRDDVHRPSEINPEDYSFLFAFQYADAWGYSYNAALLAAVRRQKATYKELEYGCNDAGFIVITGTRELDNPWPNETFFKKVYVDEDIPSSGGCDICGARYKEGAVFRHIPTGELIEIGHICADKLGMEWPKGEWTRVMRERAELRATAKYKAAQAEYKSRIKAEAIEFMSAHEGLEVALETDHRISKDLRAKLWQFGRLSEKQVAFAMKLYNESLKPTIEELPSLMPPGGKQSIEGEITSVKPYDSDFGTTWKMTVLVKTDEGQFRAWGTCPAVILDAHRPAVDDKMDIRGRRVTFNATLKPKEAGFAVFSRPTSAKFA